MGHALIRAARKAGIRISLLDAGYFTGGFGGDGLDPVQTRFADASPEVWMERVAALREAYAHDGDVVIGIAPHSVRAVPETALDHLAGVAPDGPRHIHVSEQPAENEQCLEATGTTPTGLLHRHGLLGPDTTLVHATHVTDEDIDLIASSGAAVCYCVTTERDLADGLGRAADLSAAGIRLCVGSDSHAVIDPFEEMRGIEMHARLATGRRGVLPPASLLAAGTVSGSRSLGFPDGGLAVGSPADFVVVSLDSPRLTGMDIGTALDTVVFSATSSDVSDVFVAGKKVVGGGVHPVWAETKAVLGP
jgi:formiminoglutamate deiminase